MMSDTLLSSLTEMARIQSAMLDQMRYSLAIGAGDYNALDDRLTMVLSDLEAMRPAPPDVANAGASAAVQASDRAPTHHLLTWLRGDITVTGPFDTAALASWHGQRWQRDHDDNPCWQALECDGPGPAIIQRQPDTIDPATEAARILAMPLSSHMRMDLINQAPDEVVNTIRRFCLASRQAEG